MVIPIKHWTPHQLAAAAGMHPNTIRWHCRHGRLAGRAAMFGAVWLIPDFSAREFLAWTEAKRTPR